VKLTQEQVQAVVRMMVLAKYEDKTLSLAEDEDLRSRIEAMQWQSGESVDLFIGRATAEVRAAKDDPDARAKFLAAQCALLTESETKQFAIKQLSGVLRSDGMDPEEASLLQEVQQLLK